MTEDEKEQRRQATIEAEDAALIAGHDAKEILEHPRFREVSKKLEEKYRQAMLDAKTDDERRTAQALANGLIELLRQFQAMLGNARLAAEQRENRESHEAKLAERKTRK